MSREMSVQHLKLIGSPCTKNFLDEYGKTPKSLNEQSAWCDAKVCCLVLTAWSKYRMEKFLETQYSNSSLFIFTKIIITSFPLFPLLLCLLTYTAILWFMRWTDKFRIFPYFYSLASKRCFFPFNLLRWLYVCVCSVFTRFGGTAVELFRIHIERFIRTSIEINYHQLENYSFIFREFYFLTHTKLHWGSKSFISEQN